MLAADMAAGQSKVFAQEIDQGLARHRRALRRALAVDSQGISRAWSLMTRASSQLLGDAAEQHAGEMLLHLGGRLHIVAGRIKVERFDRVVDRLPLASARFGLSRAHRRIRRRRNRPAARRIGPCRPPARARRESDNRIVAVPARQFGKSDARVLIGARARGWRSALLAAPSAVSNRPLKKSCALMVRLPFGPVDVDLAVERQQAGRQFGRRIGECDGAAEGAAVADRRMADVRHGARDQRRMLGDHVGALGLSMARQRADLDVLLLLGNAARGPSMTVDVDQQLGCGQPHIERGDQALPARQQPRILLAEQCHRLVERSHLFVGKWRRLHVSFPLLFLL